MTNVNATCRTCGTIIKTSVGNRDYFMSIHIEKFHPDVYRNASKIKTRIDELKREFTDITGCFDVKMFPERK